MKRRNLMMVLACVAALLVGLTAAATNAGELPTRIFHIGIIAALPRSSPEHVVFEHRLRELAMSKAAT